MYKSSRRKKATINVVVGFLHETIAMIAGFILPRLIIKTFGSDVNGLTAAIGQFISYASLFQSGVGGVTRAALYRPLSNGDQDQVNGILNATHDFMKKVAFAFVGFVFILSIVYPFLVQSQFNWLFSFTLVLIIGSSAFMQYFFGITFKILLSADQKQYINAIVQIVTILLNLGISVLMIKLGFSIHLVKLISSFIFMLHPLFIYFYVKHKYKIKVHVPPDNSAINKKWDAFAYQIARFLISNIDILILSLFVRTEEISVYTVYALVVTGISKIFYSFLHGLEATFGNMIAKNEHKTIKRNLRIYDFIMHTLSIIIFSVAAVLLTPFIKLYTAGVTDVNYIRDSFGILFLFSTLIKILITPYDTIIKASGHYKETRNYALIDLTINLVLSFALAPIDLIIPGFGLIGVMIGAIVARVYHITAYAKHTYDEIEKNTKFGYFIKRCITTIISIAIITIILKFVPTLNYNSFIAWIINAVIITLFSTIITFTMSFALFKKDLRETWSFIKVFFVHKKKEV